MLTTEVKKDISLFHPLHHRIHEEIWGRGKLKKLIT